MATRIEYLQLATNGILLNDEGKQKLQKQDR